jgi:hypothetical protein
VTVGLAGLEVVGDFAGDGAGRYEVGAGEGGEEVVEGVFIGEVDDGERGGEGALVGFFAVQEVVLTEGEIEEAARCHSRGIVVVVFGVGRGDGKER